MAESRSAATVAWPHYVVAPSTRTKIARILQPGERLLWTGAPDPGSTLRTQAVLWWVGMPWTAVSMVVMFFDLVPQSWSFFLLVTGGVFLAAPILLAVQAGGTIYAITDRRAILMHNALGKNETVSVPFKDMDENFEIMETNNGAGHLYFTSNMSTELCYADYDGKLAFRELGRPQEIAALLDRIRKHHKSRR